MSKQDLRAQAPRSKKLTRRKAFLFKSIGILSPLVMLLLLELILRLFHYGSNMDLFIQSKTDGDLLVLNPVASHRYFVNEGLAPTGNREFFKKKKEKNTTRIFILGESTTIGYPYFHNGSFSRWLQYRLMHTLPDQKFEIINLSLTAVNSYTVLGFARELVHYEPDAVLIYSGQNEYYGALGVGSTNRLGGSRFLIGIMLRLRKLRTIQLFSNIYEKSIQGNLVPTKNEGGTLMKMMVANQKIPYQSELYAKGVEQFRTNLTETVEVFNNLHIPVFISTLVSNEKDLKPFVDISADSIRFPGFKPNYTKGLAALEEHKASEAWLYLNKANDLYDKDALCNYYLGLVACDRENYSEAALFFSKAVDLDGLRFRAPTEFNAVIRKICNSFPNAHLVDTRAAFENSSRQHIIGSELMLEHVHPNLKGYAIMSDAFYTAIKNSHIIPDTATKEMSLTELELQMPITRVDSLSGIYRIAKLKKSWPFQEIAINDSFRIETDEERLAHGLVFRELQWGDAMDSLYNYYLSKKDYAGATTVMQALVLEHPGESALYEKTAMLFGQIDDLANAALYFKKAFALSPSAEIARYLFVIYFKLDEPGKAIPYLDYSIQNSSQAAALVSIKSLAGEIMELQKKYSADSSNNLISNQIADLYFKMGNKEGAEKYVQKVLRTDTANKDALLLLSRIKKG